MDTNPGSSANGVPRTVSGETVSATNGFFITGVVALFEESASNLIGVGSCSFVVEKTDSHFAIHSWFDSRLTVRAWVPNIRSCKPYRA
jgi:hypothetical protein